MIITIDEQELMNKLDEIRHENDGDPEQAHIEADELIISLMPPGVIAAYNLIEKWYA